jgi:hypothetical protein
MTKKPPKAEEKEAALRAINAQPWKPILGMVKRVSLHAGHDRAVPWQRCGKPLAGYPTC